MSTNQKLREALHKAKAALSLALSDVDWRKDSLTQPVIHKAYNCAHEALAMPTAAPEQTVPSVVWIVSNKTSSTVFATEEFAQKFISSFSGSVAGGFSVSRVDVIGAMQPATDAGVMAQEVGLTELRGRFESDWAKRHHPIPMNTRTRDDGSYVDPRIQGEWDAFQADEALREKQVAKLDYESMYCWLTAGKRGDWIWNHVLTDEEKNLGNGINPVVIAALRAKGGK